jgi:hypothetical protein
MKLKGIKISREAKILFGLMCLAAAILIWVNFATQRQGGFALFGNQEATLAPSSPTETTSPVDAVTPDAVALDGAASIIEPNVATVDGASVLPNVDVTAVAPDGSTTSTPDAVALPAETTAEATPTTEVTPTVVAAPIAARDVQLAELPFLVTEAPVAPTPEATEEVVAETTRPGEQRATVNPFSPIVLAPVEAPAAQVADVPAPSNDVQVVTVPGEPQAIGTVDAGLAGSVIPIETGPIIAEGPLPEAVVPAPAVASLPRPLPTATSPVAPDILRNMSRTPDATTLISDPVASETEPQILEVPAAIREPGQVATTVTPAILEPSVASPDSGEVELEPVGSLASADTSATSTPGSIANGAPLVAGASPLSSYLRNNDFRFTMYASGPVGVAVFSSKLSQNPVVISLGQTLPETEFVLTSLQGKEAEFSYGQEKQLLTLDLRR